MPVLEKAVQQTASSQKKNAVSGELLQLVTFGLGAEEYALETLCVQEIIRMQNLTRVPNSPPFVDGVINLRGKVITVVNLRTRFGLPARELNKATRIIVVEAKSDVLGFIVDSVSEVLRIAADTVDPPPRLSSKSGEFVSAVGKLEGRLLLLLDVHRLMTDADATPPPARDAPELSKERVLVS